jgi:hypothetical protein
VITDKLYKASERRGIQSRRSCFRSFVYGKLRGVLQLTETRKEVQ